MPRVKLAIGISAAAGITLLMMAGIFYSDERANAECIANIAKYGPLPPVAEDQPDAFYDG